MEPLSSLSAPFAQPPPALLTTSPMDDMDDFATSFGQNLVSYPFNFPQDGPTAVLLDERDLYLSHDDVVIEINRDVAPSISLPRIPVSSQVFSTDLLIGSDTPPNLTHASSLPPQISITPLILDITNGKHVGIQVRTSNIPLEPKSQAQPREDVSSFLLVEPGRFRCAVETCKWHHVGWSRRTHAIEHIMKDHFHQRIQCSDWYVDLSWHE
jgi:hypothetical protein